MCYLLMICSFLPKPYLLNVVSYLKYFNNSVRHLPKFLTQPNLNFSFHETPQCILKILLPIWLRFLSPFKWEIALEHLFLQHLRSLLISTNLVDQIRAQLQGWKTKTLPWLVVSLSSNQLQHPFPYIPCKQPVSPQQC